jgi:hypothetical protein
MRDLWAAIALGTDQLQPLGGAVPDFEEVVVVSDLPTPIRRMHCNGCVRRKAEIRVSWARAIVS